MSPGLRQQVRERAAGRCEYCRLPELVELAGPFHMEHIVARQHRGIDALANKGTNLSAVDPDSNAVVPLFNPRRDRWEEHFEMAGSTIRGKSATGRATAWPLQMNAERRVELRAALISQGLW